MKIIYREISGIRATMAIPHPIRTPTTIREPHTSRPLGVNGTFTKAVQNILHAPFLVINLEMPMAPIITVILTVLDVSLNF